ncbi:radical SAM protein [candidate division KSB1 bacterium]|nr:radical SAM protein [candidate division KSB1 bacterium]
MKKAMDQFKKRQSWLLDNERSSVILQKEALVQIALVFPNTYEVGMSNLGFHTLYRLLNGVLGIRCERAFVDAQFPEIIRTLESGRTLNEFDIIAFSIAFELDYVNVIRALLVSGLEPFATNRNEHDPIVLAGGVATFINPHPLLPFIDLCFTGELEPMLNVWTDQLLEGSRHHWDKATRLQKMQELEGFFPSNGNGPVSPHKRITWNEGRQSPQFSTIISSASHFTDMFLVEVGRGCGRFCSFCAASHVYHPVRFFNKATILDVVDEHAIDATRIGLVGAALCDYPEIEPLCTALVERGYKLGLSSFRFETLTSEFLHILERAGIQTITLAPEAGTERLRWIINKRITDQTIFAAINKVAESSIQTLKLYFLIGLPFEQESDLEGIIRMVTRIRGILDRGTRKTGLTVSMNAFIPKPFTAFQWAPMNNEKELKSKRRYVERALRKLKGVQLVPKSTRLEVLQGIVSMGDRSIAEILLAMAQKFGGSLPDLHPWMASITKSRAPAMQLPWDDLHYPIARERLWRQWQSKFNEKSESEMI